MYMKLFDPQQEQLLKDRHIPFDSERLLPYLDDPFTTLAGIIEDDRPIAVGIVRLVNEFKIIVNPDISAFKKAKAINALMRAAIYNTSQHGANEIYALITQGGEHYQELLSKHFEFYTPAGTLMKKEL